MKRVLLNSVVLFMSLLSLAFCGCEHVSFFLEERIVGRWLYENDCGDKYEEYIMTFENKGYWTLNVRTEDMWGDVTFDTDAGCYDIVGRELHLESYMYDDIQVYKVNIKGSKLILSDGYHDTVYSRYE